VLYVVGIVILILAAIIMIGCLLPKERIEQRSIILNAPPQMVYGIVTDNGDYSYREDLYNLKIISSDNGIETWVETSRSGQKIKFRTTKKEPYSKYEFRIVEADGFGGYWKSEFKKVGDNKTEFCATEHIIISNPVIRLMSYVFFDVSKFMEGYQKDLEKEVNKRLLEAIHYKK